MRKKFWWVLLFAGLLLGSACMEDPDQRASREVSGEDLKLAIDEALEVRAIDRVRAVVIMQGGETRLADYRGTSADRTWDTESVTKSILSILVGRAVDEGLVSLDQTLDELLPEHVGAMARWQRDVTLRELMTHTAGFSGEDRVTLSLMPQPELVEIMLGRAQRESRGKFLYSNEGSHVIATVLARAVGGSVLEYARATLFDPLGIDTRPALELPVPAEVGPAVIEGYLAGGFTGFGGQMIDVVPGLDWLSYWFASWTTRISTPAR